MKQSLLFFVTCGISCSSAISADAINHKKPIHITSDRFVFNKSTHTALFIGHVKTQQGQTHSSGDVIKTHFDGKGHAEWVELKGRPAFYESFSPSKNNDIQMHAGTIIDYLTTSLVYLHNHAVIKKGTNRVSGEKIWYNKLKRSMKTTASNHKQTRPTSLILTPE